jgi:hypothetical protein
MTSPVSIPAGHQLVAADFDAYENLTGAWTDYSASLAWTASSVNPALGNGTKGARYMQAGKTVQYQGRIVMGSTTTYGTGDWRVNLPVTALGGTAGTAGSGFLSDVSTPGNCRPAACELVTTSLIRFISTAGRVDSTSLVWATGDELQWQVTYEVA